MATYEKMVLISEAEYLNMKNFKYLPHELDDDDDDDGANQAMVRDMAAMMRMNRDTTQAGSGANPRRRESGTCKHPAPPEACGLQIFPQ